MQKTLYKCLVEEHDLKEPFFQIYWSWAEVPGEAIQNILDSANTCGLENPVPYDLEEYNINDLEIEIQPSSTSLVFWSTSRFFFPPEESFGLPLGIIRACQQRDEDEIKRGYTLSKRDNGLICIEINVESDKLLFLYGELLKQNKNYEVFWYILHDESGDETVDQFLINEQFDTSSKIISHLMDHQLDSIKNGLVTLTSYLEEGATNLTISDHKRIIILTYSKDLIDQYLKVLEDNNYSQGQELQSIDYNMPHWHYRLPGSRDREELITVLKDLGFEDWDPKATE